MEGKYRCKSAIASRAAENVSRLSLIKWVNEILGSNIQKVEELCNGTAYCQLLAMLFPGCINLDHVKFHPRTSHDYYLNFRLLQTSLRSVGCDKVLSVNTIVNGRFQENFDFLKWFKRFWDANYNEYAGAMETPPGSSKQKSRSIFTLKPYYSIEERKVKLESEISKYQEKASVFTDERDFYYNKLRNIEKMCYEMSPATEKEEAVKKILMEVHALADEWLPRELVNMHPFLNDGNHARSAYFLPLLLLICTLRCHN